MPLTELVLASWNIRKCIGLDRRRDPARVVKVLNEIDADIVALQEADRRLGSRPAALPDYLVRRETDYVPIDAGGHESSLGWHGNAILLKSKHNCIERHSLSLPGLEPRGALVAEVKTNGLRIRVAGVHLGFLRMYRQRQMRAIREHLGALPAMPSIVMGDFNEWSGSKGFEALGDFSVHSPGATFHSRRPVGHLDRFAVSCEMSVDRLQVVKTPLSLVSSDHLPIRARVRLG